VDKPWLNRESLGPLAAREKSEEAKVIKGAELSHSWPHAKDPSKPWLYRKHVGHDPEDHPASLERPPRLAREAEQGLVKIGGRPVAEDPEKPWLYRKHVGFDPEDHPEQASRLSKPWLHPERRGIEDGKPYRKDIEDGKKPWLAGEQEELSSLHTDEGAKYDEGAAAQRGRAQVPIVVAPVDAAQKAPRAAQTKAEAEGAACESWCSDVFDEYPNDKAHHCENPSCAGCAECAVSPHEVPVVGTGEDLREGAMQVEPSPEPGREGLQPVWGGDNIVATEKSANSPRLNVVYIVAHDLRGGFMEQGHTPHLKALSEAPDAVVFTHAFAQYPFCAPSRHSFFSGRAPPQTHVFNFVDGIANDQGLPALSRPARGARWTALPAAFRAAGYQTRGMGILLHEVRLHDFQLKAGAASTPTVTQEGSACDLTTCWSAGFFPSRGPDARGEVIGAGGQNARPDGVWDADLCLHAANWLRWYNQPDPFFLMLGLWAGHTDNDSYDTSSAYYPDVEIPSSHRGLPEGSADPIRLLHPNDKTLGRQGLKHREMATDSSIGEVITALKEQPARWRSTVLVFHADHGLSLGEYGFAHLKGKLLDVDLRVPMIIRAPGALRGRVSQPVELVDMYPTICDLAGIPCPPRRRGGGGGGGQQQQRLASLASEGQRDRAWDEPPLDGRSLLPHIMTRWDDVHDPAGADAHWARGEQEVPAAVSHMPRCMSHVHPHGLYEDGVCGCLKVHEDALEVMGTSVRTRWWRYVVWANWSAHARRPALLPKAAQHEGRVELYAFQGNEYLKDSAMLDMEKRSIASKPENRGVMQHLHELALDSWGMGPGAENEL
jgi:arylsulfatase A-like enzyme